MSWEWKEDTFKGLIAIILGWGGAYLGKKTKLIYSHFRDLMQVNSKVTELETEFSILQDRQRGLMRTDPIPIYITNEKGEVTFVNAAWMEMTGFRDSEDVKGYGFMRCIPDEDVAKTKERGEMLRDHPSTFFGEVRFKNVQTGNLIITNCMRELVFNDKGCLVETIGRIYIKK